MNTREKIAKIAIPMIIVLFAIAFAVSSASAGVATNIHGYGFYEDGSPAYFDYVNITNLNTSVSWDNTTTPSVAFGGCNYYLLTLDDPSDVDDGHILRIYAVNGTWTNTTDVVYTGVLDPEYNITFIRPTFDLIVESITPNCGYVFANESNELCAKITNIGGADITAGFNVSFEAGTFYQEVNVSGLAAGANVTVCVTDPTIRNAGDSVTINVTADCNGAITELRENNNASNVTKTVVNNGYKGKTYTGGSNITTEQKDTLTGKLLYSVGDSYYLSAYYNPDWTTYTAHWTTCDLPVPTGATIEKARLYVYSTWDKKNVIPDNVSLKFNGHSETLDAFYSDRKGYGSWDYPSGMLAYNVTADFTPGVTNTAELTNSYPGGDNVSIVGMLLVVIYADASEQQQTIWINEECDILGAKTSYCTTPEEATAYANFTGTISDLSNKSAKLITVAPGANAGDDKNRLYFNTGVWHGVWDQFAGSTQLGIAETDVTANLNGSDNLAKFQDNGDYLVATNAILIVSDAPYPTITNPDDGDIISGTVWVNETTNATDVDWNRFEYYYDVDCDCLADDAGSAWTLIGNDTDGSDGWGVQWNTDTLTPGCYIIRATMGDSQGLTGSDEIHVTVGMPTISVEPLETTVQPQDQFDVNITVDSIGRCIYAVQYYLHYDTSVVKAESQLKGPFLGGFDDTIVAHNEIDHANGIVSYAETIKAGSGVAGKGTVATIQFTAIGERGATTGLNLTGVIIVKCDKNETAYSVNDGTVKIYDNMPPEAKGHSKFRYNYAAKKFESLALLCSNSTNPEEYKGYNITYLRWSFGDGQFGTSEGGLPDDARDGICVCKNHSYISWKWDSTTKEYEPFNASVTVTDDGCPEASDTAYFDVMVRMPGDANGDGVVDILDAVYVGKDFGESCDRSCTPGASCCEHPWSDPQADAADLNNDCEINILDAVIVGTMWGHTAY